MLYKHTNARLVCDVHPRLHLICNNIEKVRHDIGGGTLQVELSNTKSNAVYKKGSYNSASLQGKTTMSDDFEFGGEGEMEPTWSVTFSTSWRITSGTHIAEQASICFYKA